MECYHCNKNIENGISIFDNNYFCEECFKTEKKFCLYCGNCGELVYDYLTEYDRETDKEICPICFFENTGMFCHSYKPIPIFHSGDRKTDIHIGTELELEIKNRYSFINDFHNTFSKDYFYLKTDGSLNDDYGVEIVSQPMIKDVAINQFKLLFDFINKYQVIDSNNCGLHFHLDREYLNERQIRNIDYIINTFTDTVFKIGGRNIVNNEWSEAINKSFFEWGKNTGNRYEAVNLTNKETVELRCFNSTDDWFCFYDIIMAVFALVKYTDTHTFEYYRSLDDTNFWKKFKKYFDNFKRN